MCEREVGRPIRSLQAMLSVIGAAHGETPSVAEDGIYGEQTAQAVREFQRRYDLPVTGEADNETWNRIVDVFTRVSFRVLPAAPLSIVWEPHHVVHAGERDGNLFLIQAMLLALGTVYDGIPALTVSGIHDAASVRAARWMQRVCGLEADGALTQLDWLCLSSLYRLSIGGSFPL